MPGCSGSDARTGVHPWRSSAAAAGGTPSKGAYPEAAQEGSVDNVGGLAIMEPTIL
jgi:hypothetical protein